MAASPRAPRPVAASLDACLEEARAGRPAPVYFLDGDPFLSLRGARALAHALVPEERRALELVELDAATSPAEVAAELSTGGLFGGGKVVLVQEPAFLTSKEDLEETFGRARAQWEEGRQREAARRLLALLARAGLPPAELLAAPGEPGDAGKLARRIERALGFAPGEEGLSFAVAACRFAAEREMKAPGDDVAALDRLLDRGLPPGQILLVAAGKVDGRLPLVKRLQAAGRRVELAIPREGTFDARVVLGPVVEGLLAGSGRRATAGAVARLEALVGGDARVLAGEVAKLVAYVGERQQIEAEDVDAIVTRSAEDPFFALGNAVEGRDLPAALAVLGRSLADGASPHMLLGSLAATVRRLLLEKERARAAVGERVLRSPRDWEAQVFPSISPEELGRKKPFGFWMKYQASTRFGRAELLGGLVSLHEADLAMKSGQDGRLRLERVLLGLLGTAAPETRPP